MNHHINKEVMMNKFEYKVVDTRDVKSAGIFKGYERKDIETYLMSLANKVGNYTCQL